MSAPARSSPLRALTILAVGIETGMTVVVVGACLLVGIEPEADGVRRDLAVLATGLFAFATAPAAALLLSRRATWLAALLAALPPVAAAYRFAV